MARYTEGQRKQINAAADNAVRLLATPVRLYKAALDSFTRRQRRREVEDRISKNDRILKDAEAVGLNSSNVNTLRTKDAQARRVIGQPARAAASTGGSTAQARPAAAPTGAASAAANKPLSDAELRKAAQSAVTAGHRVWRSPVRQIVLNYIRANRFGRAQFVGNEEARAIKQFDALAKARTQREQRQTARTAARTTARRLPTPTGGAWTGSTTKPAPGYYPQTTPVYPTSTYTPSAASLQGAMDRLIAQRDQLLDAVANGQASAAQAETLLMNALNSGEGAAIVAQDQASAQAWLEDASNALYQTETNYQQAQQDASYAQQAAYQQYQQQTAYQQQETKPDVEYVYEDGTPASPEDAETESADDSDEAIQSEYEAQYAGGEMEGLGATYTTGERMQINAQAKTKRRQLVANAGQYQRAVTDMGRRIQRRGLERLLREGDGILQRAERIGLNGSDVRQLTVADAGVRRMLSMPARRTVPRAPAASMPRPTGQRPPNEAQRWAAARAAAARARQRAATYDRQLAAMPHVQTPAGQVSVQHLIAYRNDLQQQVARGRLSASAAKDELDVALTSGSGAAVAAQDQEGAAEWKKASDEALDKTEQEKAADTATLATDVKAPESKGIVPALVLAAIGGGVGYLAGESEGEDAQVTYAAIGGVVGGLLALIGGKIMRKRAEAKAAETAVETKPAEKPQEPEQVAGWY